MHALCAVTFGTVYAISYGALCNLERPLCFQEPDNLADIVGRDVRCALGCPMQPMRACSWWCNQRNLRRRNVLVFTSGAHQLQDGFDFALSDSVAKAVLEVR
jgi:hypothetical protein